MENGELIVSPDDPRKFGDKRIIFDAPIDLNKPVFVLKENETGRNELFCDLSNGDIFDRESFVNSIENGEYSGYIIASIDGIETLMSKPDGTIANNLG